ncbi:alpha-L-fucosidase [Flavobacterium pedocola]
MKKTSFLQVLILFFATTLTAQHDEHQRYVPDPNPEIQQRLEEWKDLKFGLLMHWGPYSQWGIVESWSICPEDLSWAAEGRKKGQSDDDYFTYLKKYENLKTTFNPTKFSPEKWAVAAKKAGMKYVVFTTKHHDGFSMFDTRFSDYKITDKEVPFSKNPRSNVTKEIFSTFRNEGFWIGAYFSKPDWHSDFYWWKKFPPSDRNPNYSIQKHPDQWEKFKAFTHNQIGELTGGDYGKIDILWLDGGWVRKTTEEEIKQKLLEVYEDSRWARNPQNQDIDMATLVKNAREKQPKLIVVDRAVVGPHQNYLTPEQKIPEKGLPYPWETCMTMGDSWSYTPNDRYKSSEELIEKLVDVVSKGGNFLLNIGPTPEGEFAPEAYDRLTEIGKWMATNSPAIYNTKMYTSFEEGKSIRYTQSKNGKTRYIFLFDYPQDGKTVLTKIVTSKKTVISLLGSSQKLKWKTTSDKKLEIKLPMSLKNTGNYVWVLKVED